MPPLRPLPFLTPTQPTGSVPATGQPDDIQALLEMLQGLEQPLPEVQRPSTGQRVAASFGDALMAAASALSKGATPQGQAVARLKGEEAASAEKRERVAERNVGVKAQVGTALFQDALIRRRQHEDDLRAAKATADKAQQDQDESDKKAKQEDIENRRKMALQFVSTGQLDPKDAADPDNPPDWPTIFLAAGKPALVSPQQVEATMATPVPKGMEARGTFKPGEPPSLQVAPAPETAAEREAAKAKAPISKSELAQILITAEKSGDSALADIVDDPNHKQLVLARAKAGARKLAELPASTQAKMSDFLSLESLADRLEAMIRRPDGSDNDIFSVRGAKLGLTQGEERERFRKTAALANLIFTRSLTGATVELATAQRLQPIFPGLNREHLNNVQGIEMLRQFARGNIAANTPLGKEDSVEILRYRTNQAMSKEVGADIPSGFTDTGLTVEVEEK